MLRATKPKAALLYIFCVFCVPTIILRAQSPTPTPPELAKVAYLRSALSDVLHFYSVLTDRKIWIELGVNVKNVTVNSPKQMPREEVLALIRGTLLNDYGIDVRDVGENESFVTWSKNPALQKLRLPSPTPRPRATVRPPP